MPPRTARRQPWDKLCARPALAGIGESGDLLWCRSPTAWQKALDVDLRAVMEGVRLAARTMLTGSPEGRRSESRGGGDGAAAGSEERPVIMITASAGGVFPIPVRWVAGRAGGARPRARKQRRPAVPSCWKFTRLRASDRELSG